MKKTLFIFLAIIIPSLAFAQSNYHPGFVLKNNGDTIKGYINYREWIKSPTKIDFKSDIKDKKILQFVPGTIKGFSINDLVTYRTYTGILSMGVTDPLKLKNINDTTTKFGTVFLQKLTSGKYLTLFCYSDEIKTRFFISDNNSEPVELKYILYYNGDHETKSSDIYKGQLSLYINRFSPNNDALTNRLKRLSYNQDDLENFVNKFNDNKPHKSNRSRFFSGISVVDTKTLVSNVNGLAGDNTDKSIAPKLSLGIDIFTKPNTQRLIFRGELSFSYINPKFYYPGTSLIGSAYSDQTFSFNQFTVSFAPQILFNVYNKDNLKVFIDGGLSINLSGYTNQKVTYKIFSNSTQYVIDNPYKFETLWNSFPISAGMILNKRTEIFVTYIPYASYSTYLSTNARNQSISLGIKFLFGK